MKSMLLRVTHLIEFEENDYDDELEMKINQVLCKDIDVSIERKASNLKWISMSRVKLDENHLNCGKCFKCGQWTTDCDLVNPLPDLCNGARIDGKLLCDECLPPDNRWAF